MSEPTLLRAGDSVSWTVSHPAHPASEGWALEYKILFPSGVAPAFTATGAGEEYSVALGYTNTASWAPGNATLVGRLQKGGERITVLQQEIVIEPDLIAATVFDGRSWARRALDDARAALVAYSANGQAHVEQYDIAGRAMKFRTAADITSLIGYLEGEVAKERAAQAIQAGGSPGRVYYRG